MLVFRLDAPEDENTTPLEGVSGPGDSGGPALIESSGVLKLAGFSVASSGRPPGTYGNLEFYSRVSLDVDWIQEMISSASGTGSQELSTSRSIAAVELKSVLKSQYRPVRRCSHRGCICSGANHRRHRYFASEWMMRINIRRPCPTDRDSKSVPRHHFLSGVKPCKCSIIRPTR